MSSVIHRHLLPGEESLFASVPAFAEGLAGGGYDLSRTWVTLRDGEVVARAAWVLPPGAVGRPWLELFDLDDTPAVGAALLNAAHAALGGPRPFYATLPADSRVPAAARLAGLEPTVKRLRFRWNPTEITAPPVPAVRAAPAPAAHAAPDPTVRTAPDPSVRTAPTPTDHAAPTPAVRAAKGPDEVRALVGLIDRPDVLTGSEAALAVAGIDLARDPLPWLTGPAAAWHVLEDGTGLAGTAGDACWPMLVYLGRLPGASPGARSSLLAAALNALTNGGAEEVIADVEATLTDTVADLKRAGFHQIRVRQTFEPV
ncbi:MAG: acetyltransferase [Actinomycetota bacterium]|nr:acetyltransferase [Actinomycetota bacterium]